MVGDACARARLRHPWRPLKLLNNSSVLPVFPPLSSFFLANSVHTPDCLRRSREPDGRTTSSLTHSLTRFCLPFNGRVEFFAGAMWRPVLHCLGELRLRRAHW